MTKLDADGFESDKIVEILKSTDSVIAGSYITQTVSNDIWLESDVDIWHYCRSEEALGVPAKLLKYFTTLGYTLKSCTKPKSTYARLNRCVQLIYSFHRDSFRKVQIIITSEAVSKVIDGFDLDICRVYFPCEPQVFNTAHMKTTRRSIRNREMRITKESKILQSEYEW